MIFGVAALACLAVATALLLRLHLLRTGVSPVSGAVSDYGTAREHLHYRALVVALGLGGILLALGLARDTNADNLFWLWVFGVSRIAIAAVMTDRDPARVTTEGRVHWLLAAVAFTAIAFAASTITWAGDPGVLRPLGYVVAASAVATLLTRALPQLRSVFGVAERALYVTSIAWMVIAAVDLIH